MTARLPALDTYHIVGSQKYHAHVDWLNPIQPPPQLTLVCNPDRLVANMALVVLVILTAAGKL
jgi:hypothetical protein